MPAKVLLLLALVAAAAAEGQSHEDSQGSFESYESYESYESEEPKYEFSYKVKDDYGNDFGHEETRDGDHTQGSYYNHLPDGRLQKVKYYVDGYSGYVADVNYEGEAHYDSGSSESREHYRPGYDSGSSESDESTTGLHPRDSRSPGESRFRFGSHESHESHSHSHETTEIADHSKSSESKTHHKHVYYQPVFDSQSASEYDDEDDDDEDFLSSSEYFLANYRPQIRYQPS